jgi:hypothetical protein
MLIRENIWACIASLCFSVSVKQSLKDATYFSSFLLLQWLAVAPGICFLPMKVYKDVPEYPTDLLWVNALIFHGKLPLPRKRD